MRKKREGSAWNNALAACGASTTRKEKLIMYKVFIKSLIQLAVWNQQATCHMCRSRGPTTNIDARSVFMNACMPMERVMSTLSLSARYEYKGPMYLPICILATSPSNASQMPPGYRQVYQPDAAAASPEHSCS